MKPAIMSRDTLINDSFLVGPFAERNRRRRLEIPPREMQGHEKIDRLLEIEMARNNDNFFAGPSRRLDLRYNASS